MELRTLKYFLAVVQEGSITNASRRLHVTQPTLSRQLANLEDELGRQLLARSRSGVEPTQYGAMLADYAETIVDLADKAESDIKPPTKAVAGSVRIASGETGAMRFLSQAMIRVHKKYPQVDFHIHSGTSFDLMDGMVRGQYDFMLECELQPHAEMNVLELPEPDVWGVIVRGDDPLARLGGVRPRDLAGRDLIISRQGKLVGSLLDWLGDADGRLNVVATYTLMMNAKWLVQSGYGIALGFDGLITPGGSDGLVFVPLEPRVESKHGLLWRKTLPTRQAQAFLDELAVVTSRAPLTGRSGPTPSSSSLPR